VRDLGTKWDAPFGMAVDNGRAYVVGTTLRQATSWDWGVARFRLG
jgi:hypothetical protein